MPSSCVVKDCDNPTCGHDTREGYVSKMEMARRLASIPMAKWESMNRKQRRAATQHVRQYVK